MLRDDSHLFRRMWAAAPWQQRGPPVRGQHQALACWEVKRDDKTRRQSASTFFRETYRGTACRSNWYEGNNGELGEIDHVPMFSGNEAPALLGFDESIDAYCQSRQQGNNLRYFGHAGACVNANTNILSLYGDRVPYNICRNLEWQVAFGYP